MRSLVNELHETDGRVRIGDNEWVKGQWKHGFMEFIHTVNRICEERDMEVVFGEPTKLGDWWVPGMFCEEYPEARVIYAKGPMDERIERGEGYRIVVTVDDRDRRDVLEGIWDEAFAIVEPKLERRAQGDPGSSESGQW